MDTSLGTIDSLRILPLEQALQQTAVGLAACDADGRLTLLSPILQEILGHGFAPMQEEEYTFAFDLVDACGQPVPIETIPLVRARHGEFVRDELLIARRPDGDLVHLRCNAAPLLDEDGGISGALVLVQDVTAEVAARQQAADTRRDLLERVHHEIRTPLASLIGYVEMLDESEADLPYRVEISLKAIRRAGDRLGDLLAELDESVAVPGPV